MPGKVNPVIPEVVTQVAAQVIGNDAAIAIGGMQGHFELNVFVPLLARNLLDSIKLLASASRLLAEKCVDGIEANREQCERYAELTLSAATALNPYIGYDKGERDREGTPRRPAARCARSRASTASRSPCSTRRSTTARWRSRTRARGSIQDVVAATIYADVPSFRLRNAHISTLDKAPLQGTMPVRYPYRASGQMRSPRASHD